MFLEIILAISLGCLTGIFSGLCPGIHVNLVSAVLLSVSPILLQYTTPIVLGVFIISLAITHTFLDTIPSIYLGAPDPDTVMAVLPGHRMLLEGKGFEAVRLMITGSLLCLIICLGFSPLIIPFLPLIYSWISPYMGYLILAVVIFMILIENGLQKKFIALFVVCLSGMFGLIVFNLPNLSQPLFPMLSGLFGISTLFLSLGEKINMPKQEVSETIEVGKINTLKALFAGTVAGTVSGLMPGLGAAQASILGLMMIGRKVGMYAFLILVGGIGTVNFAFSIATLYALQKARNGAIVTVMELSNKINYTEFWIFIFTALVAGCIATLLTLSIGKGFSKWISKVDYKSLAIGVIVFVGLLVMFLTGWMGLLVIIVSTFIGLLPALTGVKRSHNMGCLLIPVILYFLV